MDIKKIAGVASSLILVVVAIVFYIQLDNNTIVISTGNTQQFDQITSINATTYTYYDLTTVKDDVNFETFVRNVQEIYTSPLRDIVHDAQSPNQDTSLQENSSLPSLLVDISPNDPIYAHIDKKLKIAQAYYVIPKEKSLNESFFDDDVLRYIFIMDAQQAKRSYSQYTQHQFEKRYNFNALLQTGVKDGWFIFIADMPTLLTQELIKDQGGIR